MDVPARLKWRKEKDRYAAYPTATDREERYAEIRLHNLRGFSCMAAFGISRRGLTMGRNGARCGLAPELEPMTSR